MMQEKPFIFGTKSSNLRQLQGILTKGDILPQVVFSVRDWREAPTLCCIMVRSLGDKVIIRSSAPLEDSKESSFAGAFESIGDVNTADETCIKEAVDKVVESYKSIAASIEDYELLAQPMLDNVNLSGVCFTRDLDKFGPYYVINYDDQTGKTNSVTSGEKTQKTVRVFKYSTNTRLERSIQLIVDMAKELEEVTGHEQIDIEFAIDLDQKVYVFQVRPLVNTKIFHFEKMDKRLTDQIDKISFYLRNKFRLDEGDTILGQMPDWNPAEIIGAHPKPLAISLYRLLVMDRAWREGRKILGYHDLFPQQLMFEIFGRPYINLKSSFLSLTPSRVSGELADKLIRYYLNILRDNPQYHDKVEFHIVSSCLTFDDEAFERMKSEGFTDEETSEVRFALLELTNRVISGHEEMMVWFEKCVRTMEKSLLQENWTEVPFEAIPFHIHNLTSWCIEYGTVPFSTVARQAFIGNVILQSLQKRGVIDNNQAGAFFNSLNTITSELSRDIEAFQEGVLSLEYMVEKYGHLRPGTYDISSYSYDELPEFYLNKVNSPSERKRVEGFVLTDAQKIIIDNMINEQGFIFSIDQLLAFVKQSLEWREYIKFVFTKLISSIFKLLCRFGEYHGISRDDLAFVDINDILEHSNSLVSEEHIDMLKIKVANRRIKYDREAILYFPEIIFSELDCIIPKAIQSMPNYITQRNITAEIISMDGLKDLYDDSQYQGKIVLIENADPGYDWLFNKGIVGLITKYGGVASHMAIRCAEFNLPAAIGCGELIYKKIVGSKYVTLNCGEKKIN